MSTKHLDNPIKTPAEDILGHKDFAEQTARLFKNWKGNDSLVVALYGEWGSGKSSIKNLIIETLSPIQTSQQIIESIVTKHIQHEFRFNDSQKICISEQQKELERWFKNFPRDSSLDESYKILTRNVELIEKSPVVIEFNPWEWASQDTIVEAFFNQLIKKIGKKDKQLGTLLAKYENMLKSADGIISIILSNLPVIEVVLIIISGGVFTYFSQEILPTILGFVMAGILMVKRLFGVIAPLFKVRDKSVEEIKKEIGKILLERDVPIIIVLDDLDRLTAEQIKTVMQLVKVNADFPNTIFFMLYQKDIVEKKLTDGTQDGSLHMEKIINLPLNMPKILSSKIYEFVLNGVKDIFPKHDYEQDYSFKRIWKDMVDIYFKDIRTAKRFLLTVKFYSENFKDEIGNLRIDVDHLLTLEALRMKEVNLWNYMALNQPSVLLRKTKEELEKIFFWEKEKDKLSIMIESYLYLFKSDHAMKNKTQLISDEQIYDLYFSLQPHEFLYLDQEKFKNITAEELSDYVGLYRESDKNKEWQRYLWGFIESIFTLMPQMSQTYSLLELQTLAKDNIFYDAKGVFNKLFYKLSEDNKEQFLLSFDESMVNSQLIAEVNQAIGQGKDLIDRYNSLMLAWLKRDPKSFWNESSYILWKARDPQYMKKMSGWIKNDSNSKGLVSLLTALRVVDPIAQHRGKVEYVFSKQHLAMYVDVRQLAQRLKNLGSKNPVFRKNDMVKLFQPYSKKWKS